MRQVPDNQEVFVDGASDASLILELLELERGRPGPEVRTGVHGGCVVGKHSGIIWIVACYALVIPPPRPNTRA